MVSYKLLNFSKQILQLVILGCTLISAIPWKTEESPPPPPFLPHGWGPNLHQGGGWGERPAYDINPHFGFRQYSEMRYEPLTTPYQYSTQLTGPPAPPQPLAPIFKGEGAPNSPYLPGPMSPYAAVNQAQSYMPMANSIYDDGYAT